MENLLKPFIQIFIAPPHQFHPLVIHFPIVLLLLESLFLFLFWMTKKSHYEIGAYHLLKWGFWSIIVAMLAGLHDVGLQHEGGNKILLGLKDRVANAFNFQDHITVHASLATFLLIITFIRFLWRKLADKEALQGFTGFCFATLTFLSLWILVTVAYVGGLLTHY